MLAWALSSVLRGSPWAPVACGRLGAVATEPLGGRPLLPGEKPVSAPDPWGAVSCVGRVVPGFHMDEVVL